MVGRLPNTHHQARYHPPTTPGKLGFCWRHSGPRFVPPRSDALSPSSPALAIEPLPPWATTTGVIRGDTTIASGDIEVGRPPISPLPQLTLSPDDDDHYDRHQPRRRVDSAPVPVRLRRQLLGLADSPLRQWDAEVQSIAAMLSDNHEDQQLRDTFLNLTLQLAVEQPLKTPFVAAVVLVENTLQPDIVDAVLERLAQAIDQNLAAGDWRQVKLLLKFLACLQSCLEGDGIFPLLEELFSRAADLQTASSDDVCAPA